MMHQMGTVSPSLEEFRELARHHRVIPVRTTVMADALTPIGIYRSLVLREDGTAPSGTFLMESAAQGIWSRWSFIGAGSRATLISRDGQAHWVGDVPVGLPTEGSPVEALRETLAVLATERFDDAPPLSSGMVGFLGWEVVRRWERLPDPPLDDLRIPELAMNLVSEMAVHDNTDGSVTLVANAYNADGTDERVDEAWLDAVERLDGMLEKLDRPSSQAPVSIAEDVIDRDRIEEAVQQSWPREDFLSAIEEAKQAIVDGEIFQVVISRRFETECTADPLEVYRMLRSINPSPYMYLYAFEDAEGRPFHVVGSSPEALVNVSDGQVVTHPIAGSRPRGATAEQDQALGQELLADEKERAEHLMLVDLARNDLLRVCEPGSVEVTEFMRIERFSHIMHIVSSVEGQKRPEANPVDVFRATFPAGTLSGAPKPRALQIIDELEPVQRGVYGGVVGYFGLGGAADLAIAIRTATIKNGIAMVQAGAGVVADSVPETEDAECRSKAAAPLRAVAIANTLHALGEAADAS